MIIDALRTGLKCLTRPPTLVYANLFESNLDIEKIGQADFPAFIFIPPPTRTDTKTPSGLINTVLQINAFMITKIDQKQHSAKSENVEETIDEMIVLSQKLITELERDSITQLNMKISPVTYLRVYGGFDLNVYGCQIQGNWPVVLGNTC